MENVVVDLSIFDEEQITRSIIERYVQTRHSDQPYINFPPGFIEGDCQPVDGKWSGKYMPGWNNALTVQSYRKANLHDADCETWIEYPVLVQQRDTFANFFHDSEDFVNVFLALAILEWKPADVQVFLTDLYPEGPFW